MTRQQLTQEINDAINSIREHADVNKIMLSADYFLLLGKPKQIHGLKAEFWHELPKSNFLICKETNKPVKFYIMENINLTKNQILTWQQAYKWSKLEEPKYIILSNKRKEVKEFVNPFIIAGLIEKDHYKYAGVFRLTEKGVLKFEELLNIF